MRNIKILWVDDEIEVLRPHLLFLKEKGYETDTCTNGNDAITKVVNEVYDIIFLDEHMPGLSGMETLRRIKEIKPSVPVVMITKSEEEDIMEAAIGSQIADYLIKPVKPIQILHSLKKILEQETFVNRQTTTAFRTEFSAIGDMIAMADSFSKWTEVYRKMIFWQGELMRSTDDGMKEVLKMQESDANRAFYKFIEKNYLGWLSPDSKNRPLMSPAVMSKKVFPLLGKKEPLFFIVIDNMRLDQWSDMAADMSSFYRVASEEIYMSILPTATQYARNALFAGLMPSTINETTPEYWIKDHEDEGKNLFEDKLIGRQLQRAGINCKWSYTKINSEAESIAVNEKLSQLLQNDLNILVYNFMDTLSHARTEVGLIKEMSGDEAAWLSLTHSWFVHSPLIELLRTLSEKRITVVITTDHGAIRVQRPVKVVGDRQTSMNLRYKTGRNLDYNQREIFEIKNPAQAGLPMTNISSRYIFARENDFLVYPNNFNQVATYYKDTLQHGGISMQEMLIPVSVLEPL
jgi:CheY-like chemotaxis protein